MMELRQECTVWFVVAVVLLSMLSGFSVGYYGGQSACSYFMEFPW